MIWLLQTVDAATETAVDAIMDADAMADAETMDLVLAPSAIILAAALSG